MEPIRVGIDVDGVLRDFNSGVRTGAAHLFNMQLQNETFEKGFRKVRTPDGSSLLDHIFNNDEMIRHVFLDAPPMTNALKGYRQFENDKNIEAHIVTSQNDTTAGVTFDWLRRHGIPTDRLHYFTSDRKIDAPVQVMIDDRPKTIDAFNNNGKYGVLIKAPHNTDELERFSAVRDDLLGAYYHIVSEFVL